LGPEHPSTLATLSWLAKTYSSQGKYARAEPLFRQTLELRRRVLGPEDRDTLDAAANLALAYQAQGKFAASEPLAREVVEIDRQKRPDDWQRFLAESLLGASLAGQKKFAEGEPLLLAGFRGMDARKDRIAAPDRYHLDGAREWILQLYRGWGKPQETAAWREK
jgi:tetratricopeptide (TPR) repeat protein